MKQLRVAILGSGNIGTDLLLKSLRSPWLECMLLVGRTPDSAGLARAKQLGVPVSHLGIKAIEDAADRCDVVFDCTSAMAHLEHWPILRDLGIRVIDMTPSKVGSMCIPAVNLHECLNEQNLNMVTCGGQSIVPMTRAVVQALDGVDYVEVVSQIASNSAGPGTRANLDEYIETTEDAIRRFSPCARAKAILILNPANPCVDMQTTVFAQAADVDLARITRLVHETAAAVRSYVPGYHLLVGPELEGGRVSLTIRVTGRGDHLPKYAGNLDIINCAAIAAAEEWARHTANTDHSRGSHRVRKAA